MSLRRVPPAFGERQWQGRRSTYIGTLDGRVANAYPVPLLQPGRTVPGQASAAPAYRYVGGDAGPAGTVVTSWPGRLGPVVLSPAWIGSQPLGTVSADGSVTWDWAGTSGYVRSQLFQDNDDTSQQGIANGFTVFAVYQMPASPGPSAPAGDYHSRATMVDLWLGSGDSRDGALNGGLQLTVRNNRHSTAVGDADNAVLGQVTASTFINGSPSRNGGATWLPVGGSGPISTGGRQFLEVAGSVGALPYCRLDGIELPMSSGATVAVGPWRMREPVVDTYGAAGYPVKLWELVMFGKQITGDALTQWRQAFATTYGVTT